MARGSFATNTCGGVVNHARRHRLRVPQTVSKPFPELGADLVKGLAELSRMIPDNPQSPRMRFSEPGRSDVAARPEIVQPGAS